MPITPEPQPIAQLQAEFSANPDLTELQTLFNISLENLVYYQDLYGFEDPQTGYRYLDTDKMDSMVRNQTIADMYVVASVVAGSRNNQAIKVGAEGCMLVENEIGFDKIHLAPQADSIQMGCLYGGKGDMEARTQVKYFRFFPYASACPKVSLPESWEYQLEQGLYPERDLLQAHSLWEIMHSLGLPVGEPYLTQEQVTKIQERIAEIDSW